MRAFFLILLFLLQLNAEPLDARLKAAIHTDPNGENRIGYIYIGDQKQAITQGTWLFVKQALEEFQKQKPDFIILELNTPGGEVYAAEKISNALMEMDTQYDIPTVCFINSWAISAGAMLAYSCRFITLAKDATMGAAEPVIQSSEGTEAASEKINSALRADFANRASFWGRDPLIAEAMVDKDIILVFREGRVVKLKNESEIEKSDELITGKGKLLTLNAKELMRFGVGDLLMEPEKLQPITDAERESGRWPGSKMLLFKQPFFKEIKDPVVISYQADWKTLLIQFLTLPLVSSALLMAMIIGFYVEINTPGFGVPGSIALIALFLILLSSFALEAIESLEVILFLGGVAILLIDLLFLPTFGILGSFGALLAIGSLFAMMLPDLKNFQFEFSTGEFNIPGEFIVNRLFWLLSGFLISLGAIVIISRYFFPAFAPYSRFVLMGGEQEGYRAGENPKLLPQVGATGVALTTLRPAGNVEIADAVYEALSDGEFIDRGSKIVVIRLDGNQLIVGEKK